MKKSVKRSSSQKNKCEYDQEAALRIIDAARNATNSKDYEIALEHLKRLAKLANTTIYKSPIKPVLDYLMSKHSFKTLD